MEIEPEKYQPRSSVTPCANLIRDEPSGTITQYGSGVSYCLDLSRAWIWKFRAGRIKLVYSVEDIEMAPWHAIPINSAILMQKRS
jgi:hypothetical protein